MSWKEDCLKVININPHIATYCGLPKLHEGECSPTLESWQLEIAIKQLQAWGWIVKKVVPVTPTLYVAKPPTGVKDA